MAKAVETTISMRCVIPFIRATGASPADVPILAREGITLENFADPDTRITHRASIELLKLAVSKCADPLLGLRAGEHAEVDEQDVLGSALRTCATLREAIQCSNRYAQLTNGARDQRLVEGGALATWELRITDGVEQPPAANDFKLAASYLFARRCTGIDDKLHAVHFMHDAATDEAEYRRIFGATASFHYGAEFNALTFERSLLDAPMQRAHRGLQAAYEHRVRQWQERVPNSPGVAGLVRDILLQQLPRDALSLDAVSSRLGMSPATLRRRLLEEETTFSEVLDDLRQKLAEAHLANPSLTISEVAFLLGFSHVAAFYKAFHRWSHGMTPAVFRAQLRHAGKHGSH